MKINAKALTRSATIVIALITIVTILTEMIKPFKDLIAKVGGHHWIGKSILSMVFFIGLYIIIASMVKEDPYDVKKETFILMATTIIGALAILIFYIWHFLA